MFTISAFMNDYQTINTVLFIVDKGWVNKTLIFTDSLLSHLK